MVGAIKLRGCTPYKLEYSRGFYKRNQGAYKSPYGAIYSHPFESASVADSSKHYLNQPYHIARLLSQYHFYANYKRKPLVQINLNMIF